MECGSEAAALTGALLRVRCNYRSGVDTPKAIRVCIVPRCLAC